MIALLIVIDYYRERLKSFDTSSTLVSLSHSIMILCSFLITDEILKRAIIIIAQKMVAFWRSSVPMFIQ